MLYKAKFQLLWPIKFIDMSVIKICTRSELITPQHDRTVFTIQNTKDARMQKILIAHCCVQVRCRWDKSLIRFSQSVPKVEYTEQLEPWLIANVHKPCVKVHHRLFYCKHTHMGKVWIDCSSHWIMWFSIITKAWTGGNWCQSPGGVICL